MRDDMTRTKRNLIFFTVCISTFMATLDGSIVNITLPVISKYFSVSINSVQWVVTAYLLAISSILLVWGKISDIYGKKYLFAVGLAIFTAGSALCGVSNSLSMLIFSRVLQAIGASMTMALVQGIVTSIFPSTERGKALGIIGTVVAIGSLAGPALGGILVHLSGWRSIFFINIPFGLAGVVLALILMPKTEIKAENKTFDIKGSIIFVLSISLMFIGLLSMQDGIVSVKVMFFMIAVSLFLFAAFILYERKLSNPLLDIRLFKNIKFSISLATAYISFLAMFSYIFFAPFYLQYVLKLNILASGLIMSVYPLTTGIIAPFSGWLSDKKKNIPLTVIGLSLNTIALTLLSFSNSTTSIIKIILLVFILGIGGALFQSPNTSSIMGAVTRDKLGVAGSINAFFRNFGMVSGTTISVISFMFVTKIGISTITGSTFDSALFLKGFRVVMLTAAGLSLFGVALSAYRRKIKDVVHAQPSIN